MTGLARRPYRDFGLWLRSRRLARRWTQDELAHLLDYDVTYVRKIEWGERRPSDALRVRLAQVLAVPVSSLPPSLPATPPNRLPDPPGPLVGRAEEMRAVLDLFEGGARLVTLLGAPGIGKTRLALALAAVFDEQLPGGARFVPLTGVTDAGGVARAVAEAIGVALAPGDHEAERLVDALRAQDVLLVLDNFEQVVHAAPLVGRMLCEVPSLRILVTSRQALQLASETQYGLPPLTTPDRPDDPPDRLAAVAAVALFIARARKVRPDFVLGRENAVAVAEICARVQGIPLAIELAAGATRFLTPAALLAQMGRGLDLPVSGPRDAPDHHRTLRAAISWSFELLDRDEQILMSRLAVFAGGFTIEAVTAVCRLPQDHHLHPSAGVLALASKSLLEPVGGECPTDARFMALEAVREFALERLRASGDLQELEGRHAAWFLQLVEANEHRLTGFEQANALALLELEHSNLRAAIGWALEHDPAIAIRLCAALWRFWWIRGHLAEGRQWLDAALASPVNDVAARALALTGAGVLARTQGAYGAAEDLLEQGAELSRSIGDDRGLALSLINLGILAADRAAHGRAFAMFERSRALYEAVGDLRGIGHSLNCLGTLRLGQGDLETSVALCEEALSIFREVRDDWSVAMVLANLGWAAHKQGRCAVARSLYEKGLAVYRALGDDRGVANMLVNLGMIVDVSSASDGGAGLFEEALLIFSRLGERRGVCECLEALAAARSASDANGAAVLLGAASALRQGIGVPMWPDDQARQDHVVEGVRAELGDTAFDVAWLTGRMMQIDEVTLVALSEGEAPSRPAP